MVLVDKMIDPKKWKHDRIWNADKPIARRYLDWSGKPVFNLGGFPAFGADTSSSGNSTLNFKELVLFDIAHFNCCFRTISFDKMRVSI